MASWHELVGFINFMQVKPIKPSKNFVDTVRTEQNESELQDNILDMKYMK